MKPKYLTINDFKRRFGTKSACLEYLLKQRMSPDGQCFNPKCNAAIDDYYHLLKGKTAFICSRCLGHFHPMVNSIFDHSHIPINIWFEIIYKILYSRNGISAFEIHRTHGYSYTTVFRMLHAIREFMAECLDFELEGTVVEVDESYISTGNKGLGRHFRFHTGRGSEKHTSILAITERKGVAKLFIIPSTTATDILPVILENIPTTTIIYTDSWDAYNKLTELGYEHAMVNHSIEFVNESASTNTSENVFSNLKKVIGATHRNVSEGKLQLYLNENAFRHSFRFESDYGFKKLMERLSPLSEYYTFKSKVA